MRKLAQGLTGTKAAAASYASVQESEAKHLVSRIHGKPTNLVKHLQTCALLSIIHSLNSWIAILSTIGAILLRMSHGYITQTDGQDPLINLIQTASKDFYQATKPGKWFVDILPFCGCLSSSLTSTDSFVNSKIYPLLVPRRWLQANSSQIS